MMHPRRNTGSTPVFLLAALAAACGGKAPPPEGAGAGEEEDVDVISSLVGDVEIDESDLEEADPGQEVYTGPTELTINLKVINEKNPEGSYTLKDTTGTAIVENGAFGEPVEVKQGLYTAEFHTPLVFAEPSYTVEELEVVGKEQTVDEVFPAGQITLHTYRGKNVKRCKAVEFSVFDKTDEVELEGEGETCEPLIIESGHYEVRLQISKKKYQPVEIRVNAEQVASSRVKLEK